VKCALHDSLKPYHVCMSVCAAYCQQKQRARSVVMGYAVKKVSIRFYISIGFDINIKSVTG